MSYGNSYNDLMACLEGGDCYTSIYGRQENWLFGHRKKVLMPVVLSTIWFRWQKSMLLTFINS